jgi:hypothetical protein
MGVLPLYNLLHRSFDPGLAASGTAVFLELLSSF